MPATDAEPGSRGMPAGAGEWRSALLQTALIGSTLAAFAITATAVALVDAARGWIPEGFGALVAVALGITATARRWRYGVRASVLVVVLFATAATTIATFGYAPGPILVGTWCVAAAGLLFGARTMVAVGALLVATILGVGALQPHYELMAAADDFAPTRVSVWVRVAVVYTVIVAVMALALRAAVSRQKRALREAARASRQAAESLDSEERSRAERRVTEQALQRSQKLEAVGHLAAGLVHTLNNTLTVINLAAGELRRTRPGTPAAAAAAHGLSKAWQPAADVASRLLAFSRPEPSEIAVVDAGAVVRETEPALRTALPEDVQLYLDVRDRATVEADASRLRQAVVNLVLHARDASSPGSDIVVRVDVARDATPDSAVGEAFPRGNYATIAVTYFGLPIDGNPADEPGPSFGPDDLRLFTTLVIARNARGTIAVEHTPSAATTLCVYWPLAAPSDNPRARSESGAHATAAPAAPATAPSPEPEPERALTAWRTGAVARVTTMLLPTYVVAFVVVLAIAPALISTALPVLGGCIVLLLIARYRRGLSLRVRGSLVIAGLIGVAGVAPLSGGFPPAALAMSAIGVALATAMWGTRALAISLAAVVAFLGAGAIAVHTKTVTPIHAAYDPAAFIVWARISCMMFFVLAILASLVVGTVESLERACVSREHALADLERRRCTARAEEAARTHTQRALAAADRADTLGRLAGSVAHDVNNALTVIGAWAPLIERTGASRDMVEAGLDAIDEALGQAVGVTRQLAFDSAQLPIQPQRCNLREAAERTAHTLARVLPDAIDVTVDADASAEVLVDPSAVRQILFNLALNARDAMPSGGTLSLSASLSSDGAHAVLDVSDTGIGMTEEVAARVFEPFFTTKAERGGTGLGLASVRRIVTNTGGELELHTRPGAGTRIRITWPRLAPGAVARRTRPARATTPIANARILLAEDEDLVRDGMTNALRVAGCEVATARDGDEAAVALDDDDADIDLLCVDGIMPGTPTTALIQLCQLRHPGTSILICSGHLPEALASRAVPDENVDVLLKPFSPDELVAKIADVLGRSDKYRARCA